MLKSSIAVLATVALIAVATPAAAQSPSFQRSAASYQHQAALQVTTPAPALNTSAFRSQKSRRTGVLLMIVGVAGIVTGLAVDEPVVTIAGAVVGGIGLYMYLDNSRSVQVGYRVPLPALGS
jgi:hypothetical protein